MAWLLDTNVLSELRRPRPSEAVIRSIAAQDLETLHISVVTLAEIRFGIECVADFGRRVELNEWLANTVRPMFVDRVLPITEEIVLKWRLLLEEGRKSGHTFSQPDLFIAATAARHGLTVVSRDRFHYAKAGVSVVDPWAVDGSNGIVESTIEET